MVRLTRFDGSTFLLNSDLIEHVDETPDTVITLTNGHRYIVCERLDDVEQKVVRFRHRAQLGWGAEGVRGSVDG